MNTQFASSSTMLRGNFHKLATLLIVSVLGMVYASNVSAQNSNDRGTPADSKKGQSTQSTYARDKIETVNLANGNLSLSIPLATIGGRGSASFTLALSYNSKVWTIQSDRNGVYTDNGAEGTPRNIYSAIYDNIQPEEYEPYLLKLGSGWSLLTAPGIKLRMVGIDPLTTGCNFYTDGQRDCGFRFALTKMWVTLPDGSQLELRDVATQGAPAVTTDIADGYHYLKDRDRGRVWRSIDGSNIIFVRDPGYPVGQIGGANEFPSGWVFLPDGTRLQMVQGVCSQIIDRNGNFITLGGTYTDQLGRQTIISGTPSTLTVTIKGYSGTPDRSLTIDFGTIGDLANLRSDFHLLPRPFTTGDAFRDALDNFYDHTIQTPHTDLFIRSEGMIHNYGTTDGFDVGTRTAVTQLSLLDGRSLRFRYNQYGEVAEIVYPAGGISRIDYNGGGFGNCEIQAPFGVSRGVNERRTVTIDENSVEHPEATWTYSPDAILVDGVYRPGVVVEAHQGGATGALLTSEKHFFKMLNAEYRPCGGPYTLTGNEKWENAKEFRTEIYNGTATTVTVRDWQQRTAVTWANDVGSGVNAYAQFHGQEQAANDPRVMWEETTLEDGKVKRIEYGYDQFNNVTSIKQYDFGTSGSPGDLLRQTFRTYLGAQNGYCYNNLNPADSSCGSGVASDVTSVIFQPHLLLSETVKDGSNGGVGIQKSYTEFEYDAYSGTNHAAIAPNSGMIQYDDSRFTNLPGATQPRGNVTKVTRWFDGGADVVAFRQYDNAGQVIWSKDPNGNVSTLDYTDNFGAGDNPASGAIGPNGATFALASVATNAAGHMVKMQYNYALGAVTGVKDPNNVIMKTEYDNPGRPFRVTVALGLSEQSISQMSYPTTQENSAKLSRQLDATRWLTSKNDFDGFDRPKTSWQSEDGQQSPATYTIRTNTEYDGIGRVLRVSDPYRPATEPANFTATAYDLTGRVISITTPDNAVVTTSYYANTMTVIDQHDATSPGRKRQSVTDALERLKEVYEDPDQSNYLTSYGYDTLDNLTSVTQGAQTRTFAYDSLKRLKSATNPESGTICYGTVTATVCHADGYDPNGNLLYKTDARLVQAHYDYDVLNRNTSITYTNDPAGTPSVTRLYDFATNGIGRLWQTQTSGNESAVTAVENYDALGRPKIQSQQLYWVAAGHSAFRSYSVQRTYDLAGHVLTQTYPSGRTENYSYDGAGRASSFTGNLGDGVTRTYANEFEYTAMGELQQEKFGTDTPLYHKQRFNQRGQLWDMRLSTVSLATDPGNGDRGAIVNYYSKNFAQGGSAADNNGNLLRQEVYIPGSDFFQDNFSYDSLNRLTSISEMLNAVGNDTFMQAYTFDRWGNRTINQALTTPNVPHPEYTVDPNNNNRLLAPAGYVYLYDDAGNQTKDTYTTNNPSGGQRTYDAENRMISAQQFPSDKQGTTWASFAYNADGQRVRRNAYGVESWFVYGMNGELLAEYPKQVAAGSPQKEYGYRNGQLLVSGQSNAGNANVQWMVTDHIGTPRMVVDKTGSLAGITRHDYLPFGEGLSVGRSTAQGYTEADGLRQKFTSKERDNETTLDYFLARYYASNQGRFTSPDEFTGGPDELFDFVDDAADNPTFYADLKNPQSLNKYQYALNNPLRYVDPDGHDPQNPQDETKERVVTGAVTGAVIGGAQGSVAGPGGVVVGATTGAIIGAATGYVYDKIFGPSTPLTIPPVLLPEGPSPGSTPVPIPNPTPVPLPTNATSRPTGKPKQRSHGNQGGKKSRGNDAKPKSGDQKPLSKPRTPSQSQETTPKPPASPKAKDESPA